MEPVYHGRAVWTRVQGARYAQNYIPGADISDRAFWDGLPADVAEALVAEGARYLDYAWPTLYASDYGAFSRTGDRDAYQGRYFDRRSAVTALALAELVENKGRFMKDLVNGLYVIMEEGTWCLPAHNVYVRDTEPLPLPDFTRPVLDLFAGETGAMLAVIERLLHPKLNDVHPCIGTDINQRLAERVFTPYLSYRFWWMGDGVSHMLNWTPWITGNVLLAAFTRPDEVLSVESKTRVMRQAAESADFFLDEYAEDGCCEEGASYYAHAAVRNFISLDLLDKATGGALDDLLTSPKLANMGNYITRMWVAGNDYLNFGDAAYTLGGPGAREYLYGKRAGSFALRNFAAMNLQSRGFSVGGRDSYIGGRDIHLSLLTLQNWDEIKEFDVLPIPAEDCYFESQQLLVARDARYLLCLKGGHNGVAHNHNDVGSFMVCKEGRPVFVDLGAGTYTAQTFNPKARYALFYTQSGYHNLPTIGGYVQQAGDGAGLGTEFAAKEVTFRLGEAAATVRMDIADAYRRPGEDIGAQIGEDGGPRPVEGAAAIRAYRRAATLRKGEGIVIEDTFDGSLEAVQSLMTPLAPAVAGDAAAGFSVALGGLATLAVDGAACVEVETVPLEDASLSRVWGEQIYRILIRMDAGHKLTMTVK